MKNFVIGVFLMFVSAFAMAANQVPAVDVSKLTPEQIQRVQQIVDEKATPAETFDNVMDRIEKFGSSAAKGVVSFAKELGVAANEFVQTPMGKVVGVMIFLHFFGDMAIHWAAIFTQLAYGFVMLFIAFPIVATKFAKCFKHQKIPTKYETRPVLFGLWQRTVAVEFRTVEPMHQDSDVVRAFVLGIAAIILFLAGSVNIVL